MTAHEWEEIEIPTTHAIAVVKLGLAIADLESAEKRAEDAEKERDDLQREYTELDAMREKAEAERDDITEARLRDGQVIVKQYRELTELRAKLESHGPDGHNVSNAQYVALRAELAKCREALECIARNTCCDRCQEAAVVARAALSDLPDKED